MDTKQEVDFIRQHGTEADTCTRCGKVTGDPERVLDENYCEECAAEIRTENTPDYYCATCTLYIYGEHTKCPRCGEVDEEIFYPLCDCDMDEYWNDGGATWEPKN